MKDIVSTYRFNFGRLVEMSVDLGDVGGCEGDIVG